MKITQCLKATSDVKSTADKMASVFFSSRLWHLQSISWCNLKYNVVQSFILKRKISTILRACLVSWRVPGNLCFVFFDFVAFQASQTELPKHKVARCEQMVDGGKNKHGELYFASFYYSGKMLMQSSKSIMQSGLKKTLYYRL